MRILALDTTTRAGSVAVVIDGHVHVKTSGDAARSHAERLPLDIVRALDAAALTTSSIDVWAVASGPGSFTSLRIGIAAIQGFALVHAARVVAVSALDALAAAAADDGCARSGVVGAWMDAHRGEVYSALFRVSEERPAMELLDEIEPATVGLPAATWSRWQSAGLRPSIVAGDGAVAYAPVIGCDAIVMPPPELAPWIGRIAYARACAGETIAPAAIQPLYVRRPDVEIARDVSRG
jgi:tRNA threonylcarbamoyladenosine biosynthesis protein TsaB